MLYCIGQRPDIPADIARAPTTVSTPSQPHLGPFLDILSPAWLNQDYDTHFQFWSCVVMLHGCTSDAPRNFLGVIITKERWPVIS